MCVQYYIIEIQVETTVEIHVVEMQVETTVEFHIVEILVETTVENPYHRDTSRNDRRNLSRTDINRDDCRIYMVSCVY